MPNPVAPMPASSSSRRCASSRAAASVSYTHAWKYPRVGITARPMTRPSSVTMAAFTHSVPTSTPAAIRGSCSAIGPFLLVTVCYPLPAGSTRCSRKSANCSCSRSVEKRRRSCESASMTRPGTPARCRERAAGPYRTWLDSGVVRQSW